MNLFDLQLKSDLFKEFQQYIKIFTLINTNAIMKQNIIVKYIVTNNISYIFHRLYCQS